VDEERISEAEMLRRRRNWLRMRIHKLARIIESYAAFLADAQEEMYEIESSPGFHWGTTSAN